MGEHSGCPKRKLSNNESEKMVVTLVTKQNSWVYIAEGSAR